MERFLSLLPRPRILAIFAPLLLLLGGCGEKADTTAGEAADSAEGAENGSSTATVASFEAEVRAMQSWVAGRATNQNDTAATRDLLAEIVGRMKAVNTNGLPDDLTAAWELSVEKIGVFEDVLKSLKSGEVLKQKMAASPEFAARFLAATREMTEAGAALDTAAKAHGITNLDLNPAGGQ